MRAVKAYKLLSVNKDGSLSPLFINKKQVIPTGEWLNSEYHPTKGFAVRQGWHCTLLPYAPHLKMILKSGKKRVWCEVDAIDTTYYNRPESQGGTWVLAQQMKVNKILSDCEVDHILQENSKV